MRWLPLVFVFGCYSPRGFQHCAVSCEAMGTCPDGFACLAAEDGAMVCHANGAAQCPGLVTPTEIDAPISLGDGRDCYGHAAPPFVETCLNRDAPSTQVPTTFTVTSGSNTTINTTGAGCNYMLAQTGGPDLCVRVADDITIEATGKLHAHGPSPLLLLARHDLVIDGLLDVGGTMLLAPPGTIACTTEGGIADDNGGSGGAGGSFGTKGGDGGVGDLGGANNRGGIATNALAQINLLRGGCAGGAQGGGGTAPAKAGGAVYLLAGNRLSIGGEIDASGDGGNGGGANVGGAGGGSGGMIVLEAAAFAFGSPKIHALGGGGGGGGSSTGFGSSGMPARGPTQPGGGGNAGTPDGGVGGNAGQPGNAAAAGGGGGGGGAGVIRVYPANTTFPANSVAPQPF